MRPPSSDAATAPAPQPTYRKDYAPPAFWIDRVDLEFDLAPKGTRVRSKLAFRRNGEAPSNAPLELMGEDLRTLEVRLDGRVLEASEYRVEGEGLTLPDAPAEGVLETVVEIDPVDNLQLSGLYQSSGNFCTQCEAEGFRRITWFPDRPDVMARYTTTVRADKAQYPVLLSNGNRVAERDLDDGRHEVVWEDPFPKPSYLFALVGGNLLAHRGSFTTKSGRDVALEIWVEPRNIELCDHALVSLQKSMAWDEQEFGLEYDLDIYMIVAVGDFNMGAMENKGLNIFNSKFVLASPETATDVDFDGVEGVIAHEYFHNWTGNRVTCRDWFQLTLKEGLTVYRDQRFSSDMGSEAVKLVEEVQSLRARQFPEDAGPMSHPIRPESYIAMDNFYTATVYEKGAQVIRMYETLLGRDGFRKGMDLYFERHDGQAVTCDDFRAAMADANGRDLSQFERWYTQNGTPVVRATCAYDRASQSYSVTLAQQAPKQHDGTFEPMHIPVRFGLLGHDGKDLALRDASGATATEHVLELTGNEQTFEFEGVAEQPQGFEPVPSLLRRFSAPVILEHAASEAQLAFRMAHDSDAFNRWEAGQELFTQEILRLTAAARAGEDLAVAEHLLEPFRRTVTDAELDGSSRALLMGLPSELVLAQRLDEVDPDALHRARRALRQALARGARVELEALYNASAPEGSYRLDRASVARRAARNAALGYLCALEDDAARERAQAQFAAADNMTETSAALACLIDLQGPEAEEALGRFYARWKEEPLVLDKWFTMPSISPRPGAPARVAGLMQHPDFTFTNPNRLRSVVGAFAMANPVGFHDASGDGYRLVADAVLELNRLNPQIAARIVSSFNNWKRYDAGRQALQREQLERIRNSEGLTKDVYEIVTRALGA